MLNVNMAWCTYQAYATNLEHKLIGMKIFHSKNHVVIDCFENFIVIGVQCNINLMPRINHLE